MLPFEPVLKGRRKRDITMIFPQAKAMSVVDCETDDTVYEGGLDKRSSLDSVQQAIFSTHITVKKPTVVIYNAGQTNWAV